MVMPATPGQLLAVNFNLMKKIINILLFLLCMNTAAHTQNFNLTDKGLMQIQIGDTVNFQSNRFIKPVTERLDFLRLRFRDAEYFDYYFIDRTVRNIILDSAIIVKDIFFYTEKIKRNKIEGMVLFVEKKYDLLLADLLNKVFGPQLLESSLGAEDEEWHITKFWAKEQMNVFVTDNYTNLLEISISPKRNDIRFPGVKFRD